MPWVAKNLVGCKFGRLLVTALSKVRQNHYPRRVQRIYLYRCKCDCGNTCDVMSAHLKNGNTTSCGCVQRQKASLANKRHGHSINGRTLAYRSWLSMRNCRKNNPTYRDVIVCERWTDYENFLADMGECPLGYSIDRIDNNKGYEPNNCRWANRKMQAINRGTTRFISFNGITLCLADWARQTGVPRTTLKARIDDLGWSIKKALTTPKQLRKVYR